MADIKSVLTDINNGMSETLKDCGLKPIVPQGMDDFVVLNENSGSFIEYSGENKGIKIEYFNNKISLFGARKEGTILPSDYVQLTESFLDCETVTPKDIRYNVNDFSDTLVEYFGTKSAKPTKQKLPTPVSKAQAKSGMVSYDPNTLANRFTVVYPELRDKYKENCEKYGEFLPEDFFINYGTPAVVETVKENNPVKMKKLFNLLNDIYEDGTNDTQSIICVTILGALENDQELLANCVDYMSDDMAPAVINVNRFLYSKDGKGARMKLENPPKYKPKKKKKSKIGSQIGM